MKLVRELVQELDTQIADYSSTYEPDDQVEWNLVLDEIKAFVKAESAVAVLHTETNAPIVLTHRLGPLSSPPVERSPLMCLSLQEILIVGNCADQVNTCLIYKINYFFLLFLKIFFYLIQFLYS